MSSLAFWKAVVQDKSNFLERVIALLEENSVRYCVIGGVAVNAYAEPVITEDLDIAVAVDDLPRVRQLMERHFKVREFDHSFNVYDPGSKLQVQVQLDEEASEVVDRAAPMDVAGLALPVAAPADLFALKLAAAREPTRRPSKKGKDILDLGRLVNAFPELMSRVPDELKWRIEELLDPKEGA